MVTSEALDQIFPQLSNLTTNVRVMSWNTEALRTENKNRIKEIHKISKGLRYLASSETDQGGIMTDADVISEREMEERAAIERQRIRNANEIREQIHCVFSPCIGRR